MIKSMTGFGRFEDINEKRKLLVEIKSVNHKYCDITIKTPKCLNCYEAQIRNLLKKYIRRGKIDVYIYYEKYDAGNIKLRYNKVLAGEYVDILRQIASDFNIESNISVLSVSKFSDVITMEDNSEVDEDTWSDIENAIICALKSYDEAKKVEGNNLYNDIMSKLNHLKELVELIEIRSPQIVEEYRKKLYDKVNELLDDNKIDEAVLATEITVFADKICVDEETVRLKSHIDTMISTFDIQDEGIGRKLDFIAQEMNREANTTLSKANDITVSNYAIELKTEIEKIREQIQNIE